MDSLGAEIRTQSLKRAAYAENRELSLTRFERGECRQH